VVGVDAPTFPHSRFDFGGVDVEPMAPASNGISDDISDEQKSAMHVIWMSCDRIPHFCHDHLHPLGGGIIRISCVCADPGLSKCLRRFLIDE
jgi:hypothetical protein